MVQLHNELLLLLMLVTLLLPSEQLMVCALKFLLPVLVVGVLKTPAADPVMDPSLTFYYLSLATAVAALIWNTYTDVDRESSFLWTLAGKCALAYNAFMVLFFLAT